MRQRCSNDGFTLVELLVVIGIIALLISMLLPTLGKVKSAARGVKCLANLRNLGNNEAIFMAGNRGAMTTDMGVGLFTSNAKTFRTGNAYDPRLATCPEFNAKNFINNQTYLLGYSWSSWVNFVTSPPNARRVVPSRVKNSSQTVVFGDVAVTFTVSPYTGASQPGTSGLNDCFFLSSYKSTALLGEPTFEGRHGGRGALLWMDGHASLEQPIEIPRDESRFRTGSAGLKMPISEYLRKNIGYLARSAEDLNSTAALYYFVFDKKILDANDPAVVTDPRKIAW